MEDKTIFSLSLLDSLKDGQINLPQSPLLSVHPSVRLSTIDPLTHLVQLECSSGEGGDKQRRTILTFSPSFPGSP